MLAVAPLFVLLQTSVLATTFYVSPTGNDSAAGTLAAPFKSITKAQSVASSGDTVSIRGGTYSGFTIANSDANYNFVHDITKSGITYAAYSGETPVFSFSGDGRDVPGLSGHRRPGGHAETVGVLSHRGKCRI
jgi:hypothetical protein